MRTTASRYHDASLVRQTLVKVAFLMIIVIVGMATVIYVHVSHQLELQVLEHLKKYIQQRAAQESSLFILADDNHKLFAEDFLKRWQSLGDIDPELRFYNLFKPHQAGSWRSAPSLFTHHALTGIISPNVPITADLRRRLVLGYDMLVQYGPAWHNRFVNLYVTTPENAILIYWPQVPWGLNANIWEVNAKIAVNKASNDDIVVVIADNNQKVEEEAIWSDLYYDYAANDWLISVNRPINLGERHALSVGHDIPLNDLFDRTINQRLGGSYNMILSQKGHLIAHPEFMEAIRAQGGNFAITDTQDQHLKHIYELIIHSAADKVIIDNTQDDEYLVVTTLTGPPWYFVTVYPKALIAGEAFQTTRMILLLGIFALLFEIVVLFWIFKHQITNPLTKLMNATSRVAKGDFDIQLDTYRKDEIGHLARLFDTMSHEVNSRETALKQAQLELECINENLEQIVTQRTQELQHANTHLSQTLADLKSTQQELIHSEKMAALGQLVAGVAHEINTPLGAIRSSIENINAFLINTLSTLPDFFKALSPQHQQDFFWLLQKANQSPLALTTREKRRFKRQLLEQLEQQHIHQAANIADTLIDIGVYQDIEVLWPLLKDSNNMNILNTAYHITSLQKSTQTITTASNRAAKVVFALKSFARYDHRGEKIAANIIEGLETVLTLYHNQIKHGVEVVKHYEELPPIQCYPDELNQVWTNLIHNALQAMNYQGQLTLTVAALNQQQIHISIADTGSGIAETIKSRIFDAFFTTKPAGEGSGLGLDIVKKIIDKHEGQIEVDSQPGATIFRVILPI